ncbi:ATP-dependent helicase HrpB [Roseobacter sinensis]|uniref:ATP-dependent helicase HrpB n=1 Tax=Roseobacter sinensis TaxID=2931391 RepID=A0ABT3BFB3_9RHOB|nr:ATP-dependent helicase HrpB [Roseobacter sp. WL0113]MCV3272265.1 ATP-dependent helicase HrpB [Roseobacter sp. WL0113]
MSVALPIDDILAEVTASLRQMPRLVLQAPPGAGKTTRVPLAILEAGLTDGRILMLEPRRLAARAAAERMAETLGERVGRTVGYRIRGQAKVSDATRIEVVTEGILTRMIQSQPDLPGVGVVIFDEFHERSLNADLGLALCLDVADALREDLILVAMSATLDAAPIAKLMQAPVLTSDGRAFEVTPHWLPKPRPKTQRLEHAVADLIMTALSEADGSALVFLPGEGEIRRTEAVLRAQIGPGISLRPLFGAMPFKDQRAAIAPVETGRKVVLATSIAETSLTIEDIRIVVDAGLSRRAEFDPASGMSRLITTRVTRAEATQRMGRAGRVAPGHCYKLWTRGEEGALLSHPPAEIEAGDLTGLALELAAWGSAPEQMPFVTPPHAGRYDEARTVLEMIGALDAQGRITPHGKAISTMPLHPRLAHMVAKGGGDAPLLAAILSERDFLKDHSTDLSLRVAALRSPRRFQAEHGADLHRGTVARIREEARRLAKTSHGTGPDAPGILAALAYPDRIGMRRPGEAPRYLLSGGKGAAVPAGDPLAQTPFLVATDLDGDPREARIRLAAPLSAAELRATFSDQIEWHDSCLWSRRTGRVETRTQERFGALVLDDRVWHDAPAHEIARAMLDGVRQLGLLPDAKAQRFLARAALMRRSDPDWPDFSEAHLMETLEDWLLPHLTGVKTTADWKAFDLMPALQARLSWDQQQALDRAVPAQFVTPLGRKVPITYEEGQPRISVRLQELFGVTDHPKVAGAPVQLTLLSPAQRPLQVTEDLPGFWSSSYADVRKDMRGRYPRHPWPEDPTQADPTLRAKPRT